MFESLISSQAEGDFDASEIQKQSSGGGVQLRDFFLKATFCCSQNNLTKGINLHWFSFIIFTTSFDRSGDKVIPDNLISRKVKLELYLFQVVNF